MGSVKPAFALHGGCGQIDEASLGPARAAAYQRALNDIASTAVGDLLSGRSALDVVEQAVATLEDCPYFNAGKGAVLNAHGQVELDAAIMCGKRQNECKPSAGSVAAMPSIANPVKVAREILEAGDYVLIVGQGALDFAQSKGFDTVPESYFQTEERLQQLEQAKSYGRVSLDHDEVYTTDGQDNSKFGTVGAVARDTQGNLAAATSTGGMTNKFPGRVGDSPIIGAGTWADNDTCAISTTGHGEFFSRVVAAHDVHARLRFGKQTLAEAAKDTLNDIARAGGEGGLIAVAKAGPALIQFNTSGMYRAWLNKEGQVESEIFRST